MCHNIGMSHPPPEQPRVLADRNHLLFTVGMFGFASGLPLALTGSTLQAWLTTAGIDLRTIGALSLVGLPYLYKFLWAPVLDRVGMGPLGRRRGWLLLTQLSLAALWWFLAACAPATQLSAIISVVALMALVSATQDIAVDAYRAEVLVPADRGLGAGVSVAGYRLAMIVSGAGVLLMADRIGFESSFRCLAALMVGLMLCTWFAPEPLREATAEQSMWASFVASARALARMPGIVGLALFVVLYKLGDAFAGSLTMSFFLRGQEFTLSEIGTVYKALGIFASIVGGIAGGLWMRQLGLYRALWGFGVLQAVTNIGFLLLALSGKSFLGMMLVVALENLSGGMGTSALVALLISLCARQYTATHFALLSALASVSRVLIGPLAGTVAEQSWTAFYGWSIALSLPGLVLLVMIRRRIGSLG